MYIFNVLLDSLFPLRCIGLCGHWDTALCQDCLDCVIHPASRMITTDQGQFRLLYLGRYQELLLQRSIQALKYDGIFSIAKIIGAQCKNILVDYEYDYIVPVPLHRKRYRERGFNQSALIADSIDSAKTIHMLKRLVYTPAQAKLQRAARLSNLQRAIVINNDFKNLIPHSRILLVDDVYTTGSTIQQCRSVLLEHGTSQVDALVIAID